MNIVESSVLKFKELPRHHLILKRRAIKRRERKASLKKERDEPTFQAILLALGKKI